jgi:hypothetical protein
LLICQVDGFLLTTHNPSIADHICICIGELLQHQPTIKDIPFANEGIAT